MFLVQLFTHAQDIQTGLLMLRRVALLRRSVQPGSSLAGGRIEAFGSICVPMTRHRDMRTSTKYRNHQQQA